MLAITTRTVADALAEARPTAAERFQRPLGRPSQSDRRALQEPRTLLGQNCTFDSLTEGYGYATELTSALHCEDAGCRQNLATSMSQNYEETWGYPFNESISAFAISCWCEGNLGVMSHGAVVIDTFAEMHATCRDQECRAVKSHTLEGLMDAVCTAGESQGGVSPLGRQVTMANMITACSCDYHALGWPFPWPVIDSLIDDATLDRMCQLESCEAYLAVQKDLWPNQVEIRACGSGHSSAFWDAFAKSVASLIVVVGLGLSAAICVRAHIREKNLVNVPPEVSTTTDQMQPAQSAAMVTEDD